MIQSQVFYSGMVQGVGFRYTILRFAKEMGIKGWVRNLEDGRVQILAQGPSEEVEAFLKQVDQHFVVNITKKEQTDRNPQRHFKDFQITF